MLKIVFFGTPDYVLPIAETLNKEFRNAREMGLIAVVTQDPKPSGRGNKLKYSEIDHWAHKHNIPKIYDLKDVPEADLGIVASYGKIIPKTVINKFKHGILNVHPSKLPEFRGASPIPATILRGDDQTTVTIIKMDEKMDHGPIVSTFKEDINENDTTETLTKRLFEKSANFLVDLIPAYIEGKTKIKKQNHDAASYTKQISKQDAFVDPLHLNKAVKSNHPESKNIVHLIKAMIPWPVAWTHIKINDEPKRLKLLKAHVEDGKLVLDEVQLEGKSPVSYKQFLEGYPNSSFE